MDCDLKAMNKRGWLLGLGVSVGLSLVLSGCRFAEKQETRSRGDAPKAGEQTDIARVPAGLTPTQLFDLRTKCSDLARRTEQDFNHEKKADRLTAGDWNSFTNHYDPEANRCYVEKFTFHSQTANNGEKQTMQYRMVIDAQENVTLISCDDYVHPSGPRQTNCTDKDSKTVPLSEANSRMNSLMAESVQWPN